ncbi:MAG: glycosyltransferase family 2 protein [Nitrososphaerota archaeon]|nr:glycosyltransferase family 2 protein [Nitrososphaerota archaeon]
MIPKAVAEPLLSVIIPVYRESKTLGDTLAKLTGSGYPRKEVIVTMDSPSQNSRDVVADFSGRVEFDISEERRGKVAALNKACSLAKGDVYVFLDSDISLGSGDILSKIPEKMLDSDIIEMKKVIHTTGILSKMVYYEYIGIGAADWMISRRMGRSLGINGAAFAIRRETFERVGGFRRVISEDLDLGLRSFASGATFRYCDDIVVHTFAPDGMAGWLAQRKRWAYGTALWFKENYRTILGLVKSRPSTLLPALLMIFPSLVGFLSGFAFRDVALYDALALLLLSFPVKAFPVVIFPLLPMPTAELSALTKFGIATSMGMVVYGMVYYYFSRKLDFDFSPFWFSLYYMVYSPLWLATMIWGIMRVFVTRQKVDLDWKV